jgi:hypothetical protein
MPSSKVKQADELFCRSCGEVIKREAELCPHCGVRNEKASASSPQSPTTGTHDPSRYETTVSDTWWYGIAGGTGLWVLVLVLAGAAGDSLGAFGGFLVMVAWVGLPVAAYFDIQYVRANAKWDPNSVVWLVLLSVWLVNVVAGVAYLYRRHEVLGEP